jgi:uncharacterized protein YbaA (DUF1428 family)
MKSATNGVNVILNIVPSRHSENKAMQRDDYKKLLERRAQAFEEYMRTNHPECGDFDVPDWDEQYESWFSLEGYLIT